MGKNWSVLIFEPLPNSARARTVTAAATVSTQQTAVSSWPWAAGWETTTAILKTRFQTFSRHFLNLLISKTS